MSSNWFDLDEDIASGFFDKSKLERFKKNFGLTSEKLEKTENWSRTSQVDDVLNSASGKCEFLGRSKLFDSLLKERRGSRFAEEPDRMTYAYANDFLSDLNKIKSRFSSDRYESESQRIDRKQKKEAKIERKPEDYPERSPSSASGNSYGFSEVSSEPSGSRSRKSSVDGSWSSRKSCQGNVNFPSSSASIASESSGGYSGKTIGRSVSRDSDDSVCTEKSINSSTISEKLPDGTDKTQIESNQSWLRKSTSGSKIAEKKVNDVTMTEKSEDGICEKSTTRVSYLEKSAVGSSLQEEVTSEKVTSSGKGGTKTVEQKTSSETVQKMHGPKQSSAYYEDLDPCPFDPFGRPDETPTLRRKNSFLPQTRSSLASEKISKLIDEAVYQDDLFKIPKSLQTDIDKMTNDFFNSKSFGRDRTGGTHRRRLPSDLFSEVDKDESYLTCSKLTRLKSENETLQQENLKLQSIIQDVTAVNKRWQKYNNERRLYVQKLLSTIQDLQEQINLISEKSAFQSKPNEEVGSSRHHHHHHHMGEIERLKKEHQERLNVLELQIKSHKDDWETERREKKKALQEKEELESRLQELMKDVHFLKEVMQDQERRFKNNFCMACKSDYDQSEIFQRMEFRPPTASLNVSNCPNANFRTAVHIPYNTTNVPSEEYYSDKGDLEDGDLAGEEHNLYFALPRNDSNERFSRTSTKTKKNLSGDTVVVEDENGIRLAITEQFPSKDSNLKSILKKSDKKNKFTRPFSRQSESKELESKSSRNRISQNSITNPSITCEECSNSTDSSGFGLTVGFQTGEPDQVTSFTPGNNAIHYLSPQMIEISRSRSEPNTRSNSSENLKPLRESSSWNNESFSADANAKDSVVCPNCGRGFSSSMHSKFLDHFELCQTENQF